jgi:outer membrane protein TolC
MPQDPHPKSPAYALILRGSVLLVCVAIVSFTGCSRQAYRAAADHDAYYLLQTRQFDERWKIPFRSVEPDPVSRLADLNDPDCGPMPPDDPSSECYIRHPYRSKEVTYWDRFGKGGPVDSEHWLSYLPYNEEGEVVVTKEFALDLALTHNRDFQGSIESLYLEALALSGSRFAFDVNWSGGTGIVGSASGAEGFPRTFSNGSSLGASRNFAAGGQLVANFVNSFTYQVGGGQSNFAASSLLFSLTQPLLRNAFRHVRMEALTQAERSLLYSVRDFARFRRAFYQRIVNQYLDLLVQSQQIRIEEENLFNLELNLKEHKVLQKQEVVSQIQVDQVFQSYQAGRISLIQTKNSLQSAMDQFKFELGLPAKIKIKIDEELLGPFTINSPEVEKLQAEADVLQRSMAQYIPPKEAPLSFLKESYAKLKELQVRTVKLSPRVEEDFKKWQALLDESKPNESTDIDQKLEHDYQVELAGRMEETLKISKKRLANVAVKIREAEEKMIKALSKDGNGSDGKSADDDSNEDTNENAEEAASKDKPAENADEPADDESSTDKAKGESDDAESDETERDSELLQLSGLQLPELGDFVSLEENSTPAVVALNELESLITKDLQQSVSELFVSQAQIRLFLIEIKEIKLSEQDAVQVALRNRLDLMNQKAQVVDSYRGVEIAADALQSGLDFNASAQLATDPGRDNGFRLDGESSTYNVGLQLDGPLNRMSERNSYRGAQIAYQAQRRNYMAQEDAIVNGIRASYRSLTALRFNFQTTRQSLIAATRQVDEARLALRQANSGDSSLTQNLLQALNDLRNAKNGLISSWLNYETSRIGLFVDLELLLLDEEGLWINEDEELSLSSIAQFTNQANLDGTSLSGASGDQSTSFDEGGPSLGSDEPDSAIGLNRANGSDLPNGPIEQNNRPGLESSLPESPIESQQPVFEFEAGSESGKFEYAAPPRPITSNPRQQTGSQPIRRIASGAVDEASSVGGSTRRARDWHLGDQ